MEGASPSVPADPGPVSPASGSGPNEAATLDLLAPRRQLRRVVAGVVLLESVVLLVATLFLVGELILSTPTDVGGEITQALITLVVGAGLLQLGRVVLRANEQARVPVLVWQALQAAVGVEALSSTWYVAVALLVPAIVAGVGVLIPGVLRPDVRGLAAD